MHSWDIFYLGANKVKYIIQNATKEVLTFFEEIVDILST